MLVYIYTAGHIALHRQPDSLLVYCLTPSSWHIVLRSILHMVAVERPASSRALLCPIADDEGQRGLSFAVVQQRHVLHCRWSPINEEVLCDEHSGGEDKHGAGNSCEQKDSNVNNDHGAESRVGVGIRWVAL